MRGGLSARRSLGTNVSAQRLHRACITRRLLVVCNGSGLCDSTIRVQTVTVAKDIGFVGLPDTVSYLPESRSRPAWEISSDAEQNDGQ